MVKVENLIAINNARVEVAYLGSLVWFTISDLRITREQLAEAFAQAGIDKAHLPKPICPRDAFRRASSNAELKNWELGGDIRMNILIREVKADGKTIIRQAVRELVDKNNVRLQYQPYAQLELQGEEINVKWLNPVEAKVEADTVEKIKRDYQTEKESYNGRTIRDIITNVLRECNPVAVRPSGGVYFVPQQYEDAVRALQKLVKALAQHSITDRKSQLWTVPVIDAEEQREMLQTSLEEQVASEAKSLLEEMTRIIKTGQRLTKSMTQKYIERVRELSNLVKEYEEMLETQAIAARANLEVVQAQAMALLEKAEVA